MQNQAVNAFTIVALAMLLLMVLSVAAWHRTSEVTAQRGTPIPCQTLNCHSMNPAHWL